MIGLAGNGTLLGGAGNDVVRGEAGADFLNGNEGDDLLIGGSGTEGFDVGAGMDIVPYEDRNVPVSVTLDFSSNDGEPGEGEYVWDEHIKACAAAVAATR